MTILGRAALALALAIATGRGAAAAEATGPERGPPPLEVLFHADLDGRLATASCAGPPAREPSLGYAALVGRLAALRAAADGEGRPAPVALLGGNIATPDLFGASLIERGPPGIDALAAILAAGRYDAVALGHHELSLDAHDLGRLVSALDAAGMPVVLTNLRCDQRARALCPAVRREVLVARGNVAVGVVATVSPAVVPGIPAGVFKGLALDDPAEAARAAIRRLRARGARVIVLMTQGPRDARALDQVDALSRQLATAPGEERPDAILAGGLADEADDRALRSFRRAGAPPIVGAPNGADGLTRLRLAAPAPGSSSDDLVSVETVPSAGAAADPTTAGRLAAQLAATCAAYGAPVGPAPVHGVLGREDFTRYVLEILRRRAGAEIALINRAFVKGAPFPLRGRPTRADLRRALPFRAVMGSARVAGATIESALGPALGKDQLSVLGLARANGGLQVNGRALDKARAYQVATIAFVADGGDGLVPRGALPWRPLPGEPDLRAAVEEFLGHHTADRDGDPSIDAGTDFGRPVAERPLVVAVGDVGLDLTSTSIANGPAYSDAQLVRASQLAVTGNATGLLQVRERAHEADVRLDVKYGWSRTQPVDAAASTSAETADLITFSTVYNFRGLRGTEALLKRTVPDPFVRVRLESELTRPDVTPTQPRTYRHAQMTNTAGVLFTALPKLRLRAGAGAQAELLASGADGAWQAVLEAGGTLDPVAIATFGPLALKVEGLVDYDFVNPTGLRQHQVRGSGKLSVPLLPALFITVGVNVFAVQREGHGWGSAADVVAGLRAHHDLAYQGL